jgi:hypothetical protein
MSRVLDVRNRVTPEPAGGGHKNRDWFHITMAILPKCRLDFIISSACGTRPSGKV